MSEPRFMIGSGDGSERGPFTKAELRWMWRRNQIDDTTRLRAESADVWITARSMAAELDAAGEETEVLAPEPEPPVVPAVAAEPAKPHPPAPIYGLSDQDWLKILAVPVVLVLVAGVIAAGYDEMSGKNQERREREAEAAQRKAQDEQRAAVRKNIAEVGWELGRADGEAVGSQGLRKPSLNEIRALCIKRAIERGVDKMDPATIADFGERYQQGFQIAYKRTANW